VNSKQGIAPSKGEQAKSFHRDRIKPIVGILTKILSE